ncbi:MAG: hypothetical protein ACI9ES_002544 [Oceanospirillaceae bacterium]|jgi:hypothetical protein
MKSLAAVFEIPLAQLSQQESDMFPQTNLTTRETQVLQQVRDIKGFYSHLIEYVIIVGGLFIINFSTSPEHIWAWWVAFSLGH